ncbi:MAG: hypothetical protein A3H52_01520 [Candidatus Zambryskibacteria bacterium RIFCSPLOWO2_02_FULL_39_26]|uniref:Reverse transcriptase domain-containing protein n=1 Tax=Candidatus Zambryskibacteria bacterium RIFCSPLOWO2_12_FULL_39_23 TaxID=1802776 RepID=A0A1G2URI7_9BACT|nr:MAG: hypothetical protein A2W51_00935 [Candidatus Zambryskibacteria bacterium RIFCSPHIGHO2_02_39_10]OHA99301.1 MAG: hypothetical protein A3E59_00270 [Candidatus Zambryskibacteria bacterium RIFCSPHIGHO2_12_FULL_39_47]OHB10430.1 MAG: hypothetical protein A3H52_01520 [Candidatus Zambryskibacteria bacterium RIFCSPLOWO2_02_FULL_39_26]OHB12001.1 MAG: hypothetical protein A3G99_02865 [Candidatus Zambryskibacteria bacterium RIFCSPLOWO2_12_FULL_39_23]
MNIPSFEEIFSLKSLFKSFKEFERGKKFKPDVAEFKSRLVENLMSLNSDIMFGNYKHGGYFHFKVSDPKPRDIHKASVRDRVVHHAIYRALYPYFDSKFIFDSYSCREGKGTHRALKQFEFFGGKESRNFSRTVWVLKCDIRKCFASVDHNILKNILGEHIKCNHTFSVVCNIIDSFSSHIYAIADMGKVGIPLGNLTSQLFINIYLHKFDFWIKREVKISKYIRYADDFTVFSQSKAKLEFLLEQVKEFLEKELRFEIHPDKVFIKTLARGVDFLGWVHFPKYRVLRNKTKVRMRRNIKNNPKTGVITSYLGLLQYGNAYNLSIKVKRALLSISCDL